MADLDNTEWICTPLFGADGERFLGFDPKQQLVRCKDCVDWMRNYTDRAKPNIHPCRGMGHATTADFFCGNGERMDGEENV